MVSYCTVQDMIDRFSEDELIQRTDHANTGVINTTVLNKSIADATAEIDSYLIGRYALPLTPQPAGLTRICCDIARYFLYDDAATEQVIARFEAVIKYLEQVAKGNIRLGFDTGGAAVPNSGTVKLSSDTAVFGSGTEY